MPTGYTAKVTENTTLEEFVWTCARAFGALILMRDDPMDAPIPQRLEPSTYYRDQVEKDEAEVAAIMAWSDADALADQEAKLAAERELNEKMTAESVEKRNAYNRLLALVDGWQPPSADHRELKAFMQQQLTESRRFDCHEYTRVTNVVSAAEWKAKRLTAAIEHAEFSRKHWHEEQERTEGRNRWLEQLRESLAPKVSA